VKEADQIWNRALDLDYEPQRRGDRALADVLGFHSLAMNGGFSHSLEVDLAQATRAVEGFRLFGQDSAARLIDRACAVVARLVDPDRPLDLLDLPETAQAELDQLDAAYCEEIDDEAVQRCFTDYLAAHPNDFAPL
jgi:Domain of unknown function (DUF4375)